MRRERMFRGGKRPQVDMMDSFDSLYTQQSFSDLGNIHFAGHSVEIHTKALPQYSNGTVNHDQGNHYGDQGVGNRISGKDNDPTSYDHPERNERISQEMQGSGPYIDILPVAPHEPPSR